MTPTRSPKTELRTSAGAAPRSLHASLFAGLLLCACASTSEDPAEPLESDDVVAADEQAPSEDPADQAPAVVEEVAPARATPASFSAPQEDPEEVAAAPAASGDDDAAAPSGPDRRAIDVAYFNSKEFKRRFALGFLSRTEVEPPVTPDEAEDLRDIIEANSDEDFERALRLAERANRRLPSAQFEFLIGMYKFRDGDYDGAIASFEAALDTFPNFLRAHMFKGQAHYALATQTIEDDPRTEEEAERDRKAHFALAGDSIRRQLELGGIDGPTYAFLAVILIEQQRYMEAETAFRQALMFNPEKTEWRSGLVSSLLAQRRYTDAASLIETLIAGDPNNAAFWTLQGKAMIGLEDYERAAEIFGIVRDLGAADEVVLGTLGDLYTSQGLGALAGEVYAEAYEAGASIDRTLKGARQLVQRDALESAKQVIAAVEARGVDELAPERKADLRKLQAKIAVREGDGEREIEILRQTVDENPLDGDALTLLAMALGRAGETAEAYQLFETAAGMEGQAAKANLEHARLRVRQREYEQAIPLIKASLQAEDVEAVRRYLEDVEAANARSKR